MTHWRQLRGRELDTYIAQDLGLRVERVRKARRYNEQDLYGMSDDGGLSWENLPYYSTDTNAALDLVLEQPSIKGVQIHKVKPDKYVAHVFDGRALDTVINATGATPALAICRAWLTWREDKRRQLEDVSALTSG
ncbi:MAG: hypothetical protein D6737_16950 [Chloroflexi bacterium]|nr:MAG: hypothetical protein D6737_16950 [Chloroflexota bacterium]